MGLNDATPSLSVIPTTETQQVLPPANPTAALKVGTPRPELSRMADSLEEEYQIGFQRDHPRMHRRYILLRSQALFDRLVVLYERQFTASWQLFKRAAEVNFPLKQGEVLVNAAAIAYVSNWFWDLYVSNYKSIEKLSQTALTQRYKTRKNHSSFHYDPFLQHLNSIIRPTHIQLSLEDALYLPILCDATPFRVAVNPFGILNFEMNETFVQSILDIMDQKSNNWNLLPLSDNTLGRPMWLFDWRQNQGYAWFPTETNFSRDDLVSAQILGIPLSPRLAPRDYDDWQIFPGGTLPLDISLHTVKRFTERRFFGSAEYRTISTDRWVFPIPTSTKEVKRKKKKTSESSSAAPKALTLSAATASKDTSEEEITHENQYTQVYRYQIIDWCYHSRVVLALDEQKQNQALRTFLYQGTR